MTSWRSLAIAAACTMVALPALAASGGSRGSTGLNVARQKGGFQNSAGQNPQSIGAPGSIAGAGLPFLLLAGGYVLVRRYRNQSKVEKRLP